MNQMGFFTVFLANSGNVVQYLWTSTVWEWLPVCQLEAMARLVHDSYASSPEGINHVDGKIQLKI